jgi:hypothetical protein
VPLPNVAVHPIPFSNKGAILYILFIKRVFLCLVSLSRARHYDNEKQNNKENFITDVFSTNQQKRPSL